LPFLHRLTPYLRINRRQQRPAFRASPGERREVVGGVGFVPGHRPIILTSSERRRSHSTSASRVFSRANSRCTANCASCAAVLIRGGAAGGGGGSGHVRRSAPTEIGADVCAQPATIAVTNNTRIMAAPGSALRYQIAAR